MSKSSCGKGDTRRPKFISYQEFSNNWDLIFNKSKSQNRPENNDKSKENQIESIIEIC
jgi:hypothetical protein